MIDVNNDVGKECSLELVIRLSLSSFVPLIIVFHTFSFGIRDLSWI